MKLNGGQRPVSVGRLLHPPSAGVIKSQQVTLRHRGRGLSQPEVTSLQKCNKIYGR